MRKCIVIALQELKFSSQQRDVIVLKGHQMEGQEMWTLRVGGIGRHFQGRGAWRKVIMINSILFLAIVP